MPNLNRVLLMGNLTFDPELRYTPSGSAVCNLRMAINRKYTDRGGEQREDVVYLDVEVWDRQAENCQKYLRRGDPIFVEGRLKMDEWDDRETGKKRSRLKVIAERTQFLSSPRGGDFDSGPSDDESGGSPPPRSQGGGYHRQQSAPRAAAPRPAPPPRQAPARSEAPPPPWPAEERGGNRPPPPPSPPAGDGGADAFAVEDDEPIDDIPF